MRFDDIDCWARLLNEDEQAINDELAAYAAADKARAERALKEYEELDQKQVDPKTLGLAERGRVDERFQKASCDEEAECDELDEKIDFSRYGVDCGDLLSEYDNNPLVSALDPLKSSTANLAAQDTVQYSIAEAVKDLTKAIRANCREKCTLRRIGNGFALFAGDGRFLNGTGWCRNLDEACRMADECGAEIRNLDEFEKEVDGMEDLEECGDKDKVEDLEECGDKDKVEDLEECGGKEKMFDDMLKEAVDAGKKKTPGAALKEADEDDDIGDDELDDIENAGAEPVKEEPEAPKADKYADVDELSDEDLAAIEDAPAEPVTAGTDAAVEEGLKMEQLTKSAVQKLGLPDDTLDLPAGEFIDKVMPVANQGVDKLTQDEQQALADYIAGCSEEVQEEASAAQKKKWFDRAVELQKQSWDLPKPHAGNKEETMAKYKKIADEFLTVFAHLDDDQKDKLYWIPQERGYTEKYYAPVSKDDVDYYNNPEYQKGGSSGGGGDGEDDEDDDNGHGDAVRQAGLDSVAGPQEYLGKDGKMHLVPPGYYWSKTEQKLKRSDLVNTPYTPLDTPGMKLVELPIHDINRKDPNFEGAADRYHAALRNAGVKSIKQRVGGKTGEETVDSHIRAQKAYDAAAEIRASHKRAGEIDQASGRTLSDQDFQTVRNLYDVVMGLDPADRDALKDELLAAAEHDKEKTFINRLFRGDKKASHGQIAGLGVLLNKDLGWMRGMGIKSNTTGANTQAADGVEHILVYAACKQLGVDVQLIKNQEQFEEWRQAQNEENDYPEGKGIPADLLDDKSDFKWDALKIPAKVANDDSMLELLRINLRGQDTSKREARKLCGRVLLQQLLVVLGLDAHMGCVSHHKKTRSMQVYAVFAHAWDKKMTADQKKDAKDFMGDFHDRTQVRKSKTFLNDKDNLRFQELIRGFEKSPVDSEGVLTAVDEDDALELLTLDFMRKGFDKLDAMEMAETEFKTMMKSRKNGPVEFTKYVLELAKVFLRGGSENASI